ncbi:MAG: esterase-like activity of phytase family protein, partial [Planctomycetota bacterium]|nr:esterase-like activity of phytase family protein [Planctomycetota bacterium]
IQDGGRQGTNVRLLALEIATGATREYVYALPKPGLGLSEILAIDADRFIVLERDGKGGSEAKHKRLVKIDLRGATDVSDVGNKLHTGLPLAGLPEGVKAVSRTEWLDLLDPRFGLAGASFPEKVEGVAWGPDLADGRKLLVVSCDNDLNPRQDVVFWAFAVDKSELE